MHTAYHVETHNRTLFSFADDLDVAHILIEAALNSVGDLEKPDSGLRLIAPLHEVYGLNKRG